MVSFWTYQRKGVGGHIPQKLCKYLRRKLEGKSNSSQEMVEKTAFVSLRDTARRQEPGLFRKGSM